MGRKEDNIAQVKELMRDPSLIRNIGIAAHIDHGKTTLSDNLIAGAGMMSEELAGEARMLDFDQQEQARGITINAANASMVHEYKGKRYLINLIDTPGHVDFGGDVTRAMRAVDGCIVLVCAVEGAMPQTETVIRQALRERVRLTLFINKVDRLINELKLDAAQMQERFIKHINAVNELIRKMAPKELRKEWQVRVEDGTVAFGSAVHNWATSVPFMKEKNISFKDIFEYCANDDQKTLAKLSPIHEVLLNMTIEHSPDPLTAQRYRIPMIWKGDLESPEAKAMLNADSRAKTVFMVTKILLDPHAGEVAIGRLFSGEVKRGDELFVLGTAGKNRVQQVSMSVGADRVQVESMVAGNIVAVTGLRSAIAGSTCATDPEMEPFERIVHISEPVVTVAIEAKHMKDLPKLVEVLRSVSKADPSIQVSINQETGEHLMSGMGELHLEITTFRIEKEHGVEIHQSEPIVVYREGISGHGGPFEGKSPNKHNRFYIEVEPLEEEVLKLIKDGDIPSGKRLKNPKDVMQLLMGLGYPRDKAKGVKSAQNNCLFFDATKGVQNLHETMELIIEGFGEATKRMSLADELGEGIKVRLVDAKLHEDTIHRGPAQVIPAVRQAIHGAMCLAGRTLREPMMKIFISVPMDVMGAATRELQQRRAVIEDMEQEGDLTNITSKAPVAQMFGFAGDIRGATGGRSLWSTENCGFEAVPPELLDEVIGGIRKRKGLKPEPPDANYYAA